MTASDPTLSSLGLDRLIDARTLNRDLITGSLEHFNLRIVGAPAALLHSLRFVLQKEAPGVWQSVLPIIRSASACADARGGEEHDGGHSGTVSRVTGGAVVERVFGLDAAGG